MRVRRRHPRRRAATPRWPSGASGSACRRRGTVGGALAVGRSGVRRLGRRAGARRAAAGAGRDGRRRGGARPAGPTVKNVSGFDLCRLLVGSLGTLAFIGDVILRTRPAAGGVAVVQPAPGATRSTLVRSLYRPTAMLWDGTTTWVLPRGPSRRRRRAGRARRRLDEVDGPPPLPPGSRRSLPPSASCAGLDGRVRGRDRRRHRAHRPSRVVPAAQRRPWSSCTAGSRRAFDPTGRLNPGRDRSGLAPAARGWPGHPGRVGTVARDGSAAVDDELASCVACGLCLPHCPTYRVTGEEALVAAGPHRRDAGRAVGRAPRRRPSSCASWTTCVQCRGCEPACPSGVPFGRLMEGTRATLAAAGRCTPRWQRLGLPGPRPPPAAARRLAARWPSPSGLRLVPRRLGLPRLPLRRPPARRAAGTDVWLFTGCVMDAWQRDVHAAAARGARGDRRRRGPARPGRRLLRRAPRARRPHAGRPGGWPRRVMASMPGRRADPRRLGRLRRRAEGLRPPARHRRGARRSAPGCSTSTSGWPSARSTCRRRCRGASAAGHRAGPVPPAPRAAGPRCACARCSRRVRRRRRARRRRPVLRGRRGVLGAPARSWRPPSGSASSTPSRARPGAGRGGQRQPRLRHAPGGGRRRRPPPDRARGGGHRPWPVSSTRSGARLEAIADELADLAIVRLRESIDAGGSELPVDERRLTQRPARRRESHRHPARAGRGALTGDRRRPALPGAVGPRKHRLPSGASRSRPKLGGGRRRSSFSASISERSWP